MKSRFLFPITFHLISQELIGITAFTSYFNIHRHRYNNPTTNLNAQSSSSSSSSSSSFNKGPSKRQSSPPSSSPTQRRRRRNISSSSSSSRNKSFYERRSSGVKIKSKNSRRTPRWEREGDDLYRPINPATVIFDSNDTSDDEKSNNNGVSQQQHMTVDDARQLLSRLHKPPSSPPPTTTTATLPTPPPTSPVHWGTLPVGPILRPRLLSSYSPHPTPIQTAAFSVIAQNDKKNVIIAAPTGTGKSLAYLLPLLSSSRGGRGVECQVMIVTPTVELAVQLQHEVDLLWPRRGTKGGDSDGNDGWACAVVGQQKDANSLWEGVKGAAIVAGTPRSLRRLWEEDSDGRLWSNLKTVVLDEADRLLRTEGAAAAAATAAAATTTTHDTPRKDFTTTATATETLLSELPLSSLRIICASATVGRSLRRQLMNLLEAPSVEKAAVVVTGDGDERLKKNADRRRSALLPGTIRHGYHLLLVKEEEEERRTKAKKTKTTSYDDEKERVREDVLNALCDNVMNQLPPAPALIFPGRIGTADAIEQNLITRGFKHVASGRQLRDNSPKTTIATATSSSSSSDWKETRIHVINDKFGRGLDIKGIHYVFLLSPPSTPAGYVHLAGRTGRAGREGMVVTLVKMKDVRKMVGMGMMLGVGFEELRGGDGDSDEGKILLSRYEEEDDDEKEERQKLCRDESNDDDWMKLSDSALRRKTKQELMDYLQHRGVTLPNKIDGRRIKKDDLVDALKTYHEKS